MVDRVSSNQLARPPGRARPWQAAVEQTVTGMGCDLVDCERSSQGLLRVSIARLPAQRYSTRLSVSESDQRYETGDGEFVTVDDCEKVTRQLQYVLEVEDCNYSRLEVSSPGLDRPLNREADYVRFAGSLVEITLKQPFQGRKKYRGTLEATGEGWQLVLQDETGPVAKGGKAGTKGVKAAAARSGKASKVAAEAEAPRQALGFTLDEVREARLVPVVDFRRGARKDPIEVDDADAPGDGASSANKQSDGQDSGGRKE